MERWRGHVGRIERVRWYDDLDIGDDVETDHVHDAERRVLGLEEEHPEAVDILGIGDAFVDHAQRFPLHRPPDAVDDEPFALAANDGRDESERLARTAALIRITSSLVWPQVISSSIVRTQIGAKKWMLSRRSGLSTTSASCADGSEELLVPRIASGASRESSAKTRRLRVELFAHRLDHQVDA